MSRLSLELTAEQHQRLKAMAALSGQTMKDYILTRALPSLPEERDTLSEEEALHRLEEFLKPRIEEAQRGEVVGKSVEQIFDEVREEARHETRH